jgi:hypothetical protein
MKKSLLALAVSLAAASGAHASWFSGYNAGDQTLGNGEAVFVAFDDVAGKSYVQDLGVRYDDLVSGAAFNGQSFTVDLSVFGASTSNARWMITAGSGQYFNVDFTDTQYDKYGVISSFDTNASVVSLGFAQATFISNSQGVAIAGIENKAAMYDGPISQNTSVTESVPFGPKYVGNTNEAAFFNQQTGLDALGAVSGETMKLWQYGYTDIAGSNAIVAMLGTVTLSGNTLTLNQAPAVPVPAAAWLMGSALLGLGGVARRRNKA